MDPLPTLLTIDQVAAMLSHTGVPVKRDTVRSWVSDGCRPRGRRMARPVKLRAVQLPGGIAFRSEDVAAFLKELAATALGNERGERKAEAPAGKPVPRPGGRVPAELIGTYPEVRGRSLKFVPPPSHTSASGGEPRHAVG